MIRKEAEKIVMVGTLGDTKRFPKLSGPGVHALTVADALLKALDRGGAFLSEATAAEIDSVAREILDLEARMVRIGVDPLDRRFWNLALRLASACRAAGLVKP